jgi:CRP-like cAMP-binding protein
VSQKDEKVELLAAVPLFAELGTRELQRVGQLTDVMDLSSGRVLMRQGETGSEMMVLVDGTVSVRRDGAVLAERGPGEVLGEMAPLSDAPRSATVTLTSDARLLVVARREFNALMDEIPSVRAQIMECLARRLMASEAGVAH